MHKRPLNQPAENCPRSDKNIRREERKIGVDVSSPHVRLCGVAAVSGQGVVHEPLLRDIGVVENRSRHLAVDGLVGADKALGG